MSVLRLLWASRCFFLLAAGQLTKTHHDRAMISLSSHRNKPAFFHLDFNRERTGDGGRCSHGGTGRVDALKACLFTHLDPLLLHGLCSNAAGQRHRRGARLPLGAGAGAGAQYPPDRRGIQRQPRRSIQPPVPNTQQAAGWKGVSLVLCVSHKLSVHTRLPLMRRQALHRRHNALVQRKI